MNDSPNRTAARVVAYACAFVAALALVVLVGGWLGDVARLRAPVPRWSPMAPLTAVLLLLTSVGSSQLRRRPRLSAVLLVLASVVASLVLVEYFTGLPLGLYRASMLFRRGAHTPLPELPAPDAAASFILLAVALGAMYTRRSVLHDIADVFAVFIGIVCVQVLIAYTYNIVHTATHTGYRQIAPHTTFAVMLLAASVIAHRPTPGVFSAMTGRAQSALLLRRLLPVTVFCCLLVGLLTVEAISANLGQKIPEIVAWSITGAIAVLSLLLFVTSAEMRNAEATVHRREQDLMKATEVAEAASNTKSRFMAVMSHELRTPLTAMLGYADLMEAGIAGDISPEARKFVERIRASGWHLVGLIDAVLLYASGQLAGEQGRSERIELMPLLREVSGMFEAQARGKGVDFELTTTDAHVAVRSEQSRLREVLVNLISNAVKFTSQGSVRVSVVARNDDVTIEIRDTGIGIDPAQLDHIWEPFEQVDDPHTRVHGGMGLGMALTRMLSDQLGLRLDVSSAVGQGSTFTLVVPRAATESSAPKEVRLDGKHALVVDDDVAVLRIMSRALARYGARISEARSGPEALACVQRGDHIDVIVTDISMPEMSGIELAHALTTSKIPLLFVTGAELSDEDRYEVTTLGGMLLNKPFDMSELARTVQQVTARSGAPASSSNP